MDVYSHGGECCGRLHLSDFPWAGPSNTSIAYFKNRMQEPLEGYREDEPDNEKHCVEVTLVDEQATNVGSSGKSWDAVLTEYGFKKVYAFRNPNSGNTVWVYLYSTNELKLV